MFRWWRPIETRIIVDVTVYFEDRTKSAKITGNFDNPAIVQEYFKSQQKNIKSIERVQVEREYVFHKTSNRMAAPQEAVISPITCKVVDRAMELVASSKV